MQKFAINSLWEHSENDKAIGNLVVENNEVYFDVNGKNNGRPDVFSTIHEDLNIKVLTSGRISEIDGVSRLNVKRVFKSNKNIILSEDCSIINIKEVVFEIRGLYAWMEVDTLSGEWSSDGKHFNIEIKNISDISLFKNADKAIDIIFKTQLKDAFQNTSTKISIERKPIIRIIYFQEVDDKRVFEDIKNISRFVGLLMGILGYVDNVSMIDSNNHIYQSYYSHDFSYDLENSKSNLLYGYYRFYYIGVQDRLMSLYAKWDSFINEDCDMSFLISVYFLLNSKREYLIEDKFLHYCRFIEGYSIRRDGNGDAISKSDIKKELNEVLSNTDVLETITNLKESLKKLSINEKYATPARISEAMTERILKGKNLDFGQRIGIIDNRYSNYLTENYKRIRHFDIQCEPDSDLEKSALIRKIVDTRNYYSHFKDDSDGILSLEEMINTSNLLNKLITKIILYEIGFNMDEILIRD
ncbi:HEPN domain-containing protein [Acetobacterium carbinolicum]|uniref:HEPN domain-containing protein n=1 Tax=Acetobacterium carbinolicum TaxID=52690 RepID=UPI0039BF394B